jgi:hypothetical protein
MARSRSRHITGNTITTKSWFGSHAEMVVEDREVGVLTDNDVARGRIGVDLANRIKSNILEFFTGSFTDNEEHRRYAIELLSKVAENRRLGLLKSAPNFVSNRAKIFEMGKEKTKQLTDFLVKENRLRESFLVAPIPKRKKVKNRSNLSNSERRAAIKKWQESRKKNRGE